METIQSYSDFWKFYLTQHSRIWTIRVHVFGTLSGFAIAAIGFFTYQPKLLLVALAVGYGAAWTSHFFIEKNKPASWSYPLWSFISELRLIHYYFFQMPPR